MHRALSNLSIYALALAMAFGLSAIPTHAAEQPKVVAHADDDTHYVISMQTVNIYGHSVTLSKYFKSGMLCQQYVQSVSHSEDPSGFSTSAHLDEICDVPESRKRADGSDDLVPKKLVEMRTTQADGYAIQLPIVRSGGAK
jgi:hypothetical protein